MLRKLFLQTFEQNKTEKLPSHISKLVAKTAREFVKRHHTTDPVLQRKILELAHATLHMRIYQRYGSQDNEIMTTAYSDLTRRIIAARPASPEQGSLQNPALAT